MSIPPDEFLAPSIKHHYGLFVIRKLLLETITAQRHLFRGTLVDVGCGRMPYRPILLQNSAITEYIGVDWPDAPYHVSTPPDVYWDGKSLPFADSTADTCLATEVFEHLPNGVKVASEVHRILKPGGVFYLTVPFFWPFHEVPYDEYRYTPFSLSRILQEAGFNADDIHVGATGGWLATLAQVLAQVVVMEVRSPRLRKRLRQVSSPIILWLLKKDRPPAEFTNHSMALGLHVVAYKRSKTSL
ncbi:methyltransferase domain-containing protein [Persicitalea sp.]|uniref:methyltransferase domain-containing protein n=1 Tax=Persicitalea sp. TaxID=3100273 RepID=UPI0035931A5B